MLFGVTINMAPLAGFGHSPRPLEFGALVVPSVVYLTVPIIRSFPTGKAKRNYSGRRLNGALLVARRLQRIAWIIAAKLVDLLFLNANQMKQQSSIKRGV